MTRHLLAVVLAAVLTAPALGQQIVSQQWTASGLDVGVRLIIQPGGEARARVCVLQWSEAAPDARLRTTEVACDPPATPAVSPPLPLQQSRCFRAGPGACAGFVASATCATCEEVASGVQVVTFRVRGACDAGVPYITAELPSCLVSAWNYNRYDWRGCFAGAPTCG